MRLTNNLLSSQGKYIGDKNITISMVGQYPPYIGGTSTFLSHLVPELERKGIYCQIFNTKKGNPGSGIVERIRRLVFFFRVAWKVGFSGNEIVHCHAGNWGNLLGHGIVLAICRWKKKTMVLTLHAGDMLPHIIGGKSRSIARRIFQLPHVVTTVTPGLRDEVISLGVKKVYFIPNELLYLSIKEDNNDTIPDSVHNFISLHSPIVISVGAMERVHGIDILLRAVYRLKPFYPRLGAIIIAYKSIDTKYQAEVETLISENNLASSVLFPHSLPSIPAVVRMADVFVRATYTDGDSIAVREALALGVPVIASQVGFRPERVTLFPTGDYIQLAAKIREVLSYPYNHTGVTGVASSENTVKEYLNVYTIAERIAGGE